MSQRSPVDLFTEYVRELPPRDLLRFKVDPGALQREFEGFLAKLTPQEQYSLWGDILEPHTVMLALTRGPASTATDVCNNGTGSLINTGTAKLLITNYHVYDKLNSLRFENSESLLMMSGAHGINFLDVTKAQVLGIDKQSDLAVLHIPASYVVQQRKVFFKCNAWPPPRPQQGMTVLTFGYPGEGRVPEGKVLGARPYLMGMNVSAVAKDFFTAIHPDEDVDITTPNWEESLTKLGGMSGSAVFVLDKEFGQIRLAGFMKETFMNQIVVTYADHINADGNIRDRS